ncbi:DUF4275 family protein [Ideonella azotifigens]|uniref:DUF4275 family protein n=1 Tax=Ideonella azotifigens TaxID=513160 RepID=A0ABP3VT21_9BURK|nr:DUF4275 family protein [Ideonella azotifigens]MCD2340552.1 DUF4275 family protein [Ideonella azotifigens]
MKRNFLKPATSIEGVLRCCTPDETLVWGERWLDVFGRNRHGVNADDYLWHVFSGGRYPSLDAAEARAVYAAHSAERYILLSNDQRSAFVLDRKPVNWPERDYNVFPENLAWNMAFTHEEGWLGPYFAKHADYVQLEAANQQRLEKRRQAEVARARGWC